MAAHTFDAEEPMFQPSPMNSDVPLFPGAAPVYQRVHERRRRSPWLLAGIAVGALAIGGIVFATVSANHHRATKPANPVLSTSAPLSATPAPLPNASAPAATPSDAAIAPPAAPAPVHVARPAPTHLAAAAPRPAPRPAPVHRARIAPDAGVTGDTSPSAPIPYTATQPGAPPVAAAPAPAPTPPATAPAPEPAPAPAPAPAPEAAPGGV